METMEGKQIKVVRPLSHPLLLNITPYTLNVDLSNSNSCSFYEHSPNRSFYYLAQFPQGFSPSYTLTFLTQYSFSEFPISRLLPHSHKLSWVSECGTKSTFLWSIKNKQTKNPPAFLNSRERGWPYPAFSAIAHSNMAGHFPSPSTYQASLFYINESGGQSRSPLLLLCLLRTIHKAWEKGSIALFLREWYL